MELSIKDLKDLVSVQSGSKTLLPLEVGANYFISTVTKYYTGRLVRFDDTSLTIVDASWIADTGRFADAIKSFNFSEVEPYPDGEEVIIPMQVGVDFFKSKSSLPRGQK